MLVVPSLEASLSCDSICGKHEQVFANNISLVLTFVSPAYMLFSFYPIILKVIPQIFWNKSFSPFL